MNKQDELLAKEIEYAHLGLDLSQVDFKRLRDPFANYYSKEQYTEILKAIREPRNFAFTCKHILNVEPTLFQLVWLEIMWEYPFPMLIANRGASKTFLLALYYCLRATLTQGCKIVITSSSFRQAKFVFEYIETIWRDAPVWRDLVGGEGPKRGTDSWTFQVGKSKITAVPLGDGTKIRGLRANYVDVEEFNSVSEEVYEIVLRGFTATASNPVENIKSQAKVKRMKELNVWTKELEDEILGNVKPNQIILSGTCGWDFEHFAKYWKKYHKYICSKGDPEKLRDALEGKTPEKGFDWRDYCIIRMPVDLLPDGMMDIKAIANAKATMDPARYNLEFGAVFSKDSNGFFPRTLIESCVCKEPIQVGSNSVQFAPRMSGDNTCKYILSIDPASEADNFAIVILENHPNHNRVVYCWTIRRSEVYKRFKEKETQENNFYAFIAKKIRSLMQAFPVEYIALDSQGGGIQVMESLHDIKRLEPGEVPIWPLRKEDSMVFPGSKDYGYDEEAGLHIIEMVSMSNAAYTVEANHGLRKDLMNKMLLFPYADAVVLEMATMRDLKYETFDTLEDCIIEIEELKEELSCIVHTTTQNGRDQWNAPEIIAAGGKKTRLRKDRYSALMMGNALARRLFRESTIDYSCRAVGGFANQFQGQSVEGAMYIGNDEFVSWANKSILGVGASKSRESGPFDYYHR